MNDRDDFPELERQLFAESRNLHERSVRLPDVDRLVRVAAGRRMRLKMICVLAIVAVGVGVVSTVRSWTKAPVPIAKAAIPKSSPGTRPVVEAKPHAAPRQVIASPPVLSAKKENRPRAFEIIVTAPDRNGRRVVGRIRCVPIEDDRPGQAAPSRFRVYEERRRVKLSELTSAQQRAVRRLFNLPESTAAPQIL